MPFWMSGALAAMMLVGAGCAKKDGGEGNAAASASAAASTAAAASAAPVASAEPAPAASAAKDDRDACPEGNKPPELTYADVKFDWSETPKIADAPKDKAYANAGGNTFELPKIELCVYEGRGEINLRTHNDVLLGPSMTMKGTPKAGLVVEEKFGPNKGYFQAPKKGVESVECARQTTSSNSPNARIVKITEYDGKTADGTFVSTWQENFGEKRKFWAAGTFKDAKVVIFKN